MEGNSSEKLNSVDNEVSNVSVSELSNTELLNSDEIDSKEIDIIESEIKVDSVHPSITEAEHIYSLIASAVPKKDGFRKNIGKRDFALWVLPILAINKVRRFTSKNTNDIVKPFDEKTEKSYVIKGTETVYTSTKNVFQGDEKMRFFGFRFMSIWVFPMAITGAFMEFLFVGPLNGTNPFG